MLWVSFIEIKDTIIAVTLECRVKNRFIITVDYHFCTTSNVKLLPLTMTSALLVMYMDNIVWGSTFHLFRLFYPLLICGYPSCPLFHLKSLKIARIGKNLIIDFS